MAWMFCRVSGPGYVYMIDLQQVITFAHTMTMSTSSPSRWKMTRVRLAVEIHGVVHAEKAFVVRRLIYCRAIVPATTGMQSHIGICMCVYACKRIVHVIVQCACLNVELYM